MDKFWTLLGFALIALKGLFFIIVAFIVFHFVAKYW